MEIKSSQPRNQRLAVLNAPLHQRKKLISATLSKPLREELGMRNIPLRVGDKVEVMRGSSQGKQGKIVVVDRADLVVEIEGLNRKKSTGKETPLRIHPSNLRIVELNKEDAKRFKHAKKKVQAGKKPEKKEDSKAKVEAEKVKE